MDPGAKQAAGTLKPVILYAGVFEDGIYRWDPAGAVWAPVSRGLPDRSTILSFAADSRRPGLLWAGHDGGGIYRSTDGGDHWSNVGVGAGENLAPTLAVDYSAPESVLMGTATAGVWALRPNTQPAPSPQATVPASSAPVAAWAGVDARIEVVWPHDWAPVNEAKLANLGLRLFIPASLMPPACGWRPKVAVWQAANTDPAEPLAPAEQRSVDGQPFPFWTLNDVDVSRAADLQQRLYFMVRVEGVDTATSVWAHGADPRTYFPRRMYPVGSPPTRSTPSTPASRSSGRTMRPVLFGPSPKARWQTSPLRSSSTARALGAGGVAAGRTQPLRCLESRGGAPAGQTGPGVYATAGAITYPVWEFDNIPVGARRCRAMRLRRVPRKTPRTAVLPCISGSWRTACRLIRTSGARRRLAHVLPSQGRADPGVYAVIFMATWLALALGLGLTLAAVLLAVWWRQQSLRWAIVLTICLGAALGLNAWSGARSA